MGEQSADEAVAMLVLKLAHNVPRSSFTRDQVVAMFKSALVLASAEEMAKPKKKDDK